MTRNGQIMMTYRCSAACRHCLVMASPGQDGAVVSIDDAVQYGRDFTDLGRQVIIAGGEALLYFDHVLAMCRALKRAGVPVAFVESNGSWCTSDRRVEERLAMLRDAGVQGMYFSMDPYHQEFVPAERVCRGIRIALQWFGEEHVHAPRRDLTAAQELENVARDPDALRQHVRARPAHFIGRAADDLSALVDAVPTEDLAQQDCRADLDVDQLKEIQVDPFGFVRPDWCPGVNLGNTRRQRLADLARTRHVLSTPLLRDMAERGPAALLPTAQRFGFAPRSAYASKCHLCFEARRCLVRHMPDAFGPRQCYEVCPGG